MSAKWRSFGPGFNVLIMATAHTPFYEIVDVQVCHSTAHTVRFSLVSHICWDIFGQF